MQQSMPDDFRGRAFALFDIAYNLGFIIPALILSFVWIEDDADADARDPGRVGRRLPGADRARVCRWSRRIRDQFAPQDDLVEQEV